ncbi:hypothetical protein XBKQ1_2030003 [Xenorhabdus bovienii str. kraussei Quebec]|uniref:Uncharacterized protein n=2 Tax=Xenorhabdus bovienii TaxID=40576 RepID=A0A077PF33_XENBV|nr:hypothetical protein XBFFR1_1900013 [Xenorhabdus bovienii str. feltiae France]CDG91994.1 hypothetical protein XBFFL1_1910013 [Xenorhabdus bovienii str. feltiae Florida]CDH04719.1 hypothetical protein XBO1_1370015 [Xenorhabdus bovienii str. oregonense]CDH19306.1 hypothetical protein XBKQ1_2030003 [Xenorhabdus bovienii str. kraussei Quebec]
MPLLGMRRVSPVIFAGVSLQHGRGKKPVLSGECWTHKMTTVSVGYSGLPFNFSAQYQDYLWENHPTEVRHMPLPVNMKMIMMEIQYTPSALAASLTPMAGMITL